MGFSMSQSADAIFIPHSAIPSWQSLEIMFNRISIDDEDADKVPPPELDHSTFLAKFSETQNENGLPSDQAMMRFLLTGTGLGCDLVVLDEDPILRATEKSTGSSLARQKKGYILANNAESARSQVEKNSIENCSTFSTPNAYTTHTAVVEQANEYFFVIKLTTITVENPTDEEYSAGDDSDSSELVEATAPSRMGLYRGVVLADKNDDDHSDQFEIDEDAVSYSMGLLGGVELPDELYEICDDDVPLITRKTISWPLLNTQLREISTPAITREILSWSLWNSDYYDANQKVLQPPYRTLEGFEKFIRRLEFFQTYGHEMLIKFDVASIENGAKLQACVVELQQKYDYFARGSRALCGAELKQTTYTLDVVTGKIVTENSTLREIKPSTEQMHFDKV